MLSEARYQSHSGVAFNPPVYPGVYNRGITANATAAARDCTEAKCQELIKQYEVLKGVEKRLKNLIVGAVDEVYLEALKNDIVGYINVTPHQMIEHIQTTMTTFMVVNIRKIKTARDKSYDPEQKMMLYVKDIEKETEKLTREGITTDENELISIMVWRLMETGDYIDEVKAWDHCPIAENTLADCKGHFIAAYHTNKAFQKATAGGQGYVNKV